MSVWSLRPLKLFLLQRGLLGLQHQFATMICFRVIAGRIAFHPSQPHQGEKRIFLKPVLSVLGFEGIQCVANFPLILIQFEWNEQVWPPHISIVLGNLVFEDQVVSKRVPSELGNQAMILVGVTIPMRENQIWVHLALHLFEIFFCLAAAVRQKAIAKILENDLLLAAGRKKLRGLCGLLTARPCGTENHPVELQIREGVLEMEQGAAAADLNIVGMRSEAKDRQSFAGLFLQVEWKHALVDFIA